MAQAVSTERSILLVDHAGELAREVHACPLAAIIARGHGLLRAVLLYQGVALAALDRCIQGVPDDLVDAKAGQPLRHDVAPLVVLLGLVLVDLNLVALQMLEDRDLGVAAGDDRLPDSQLELVVSVPALQEQDAVETN